MNSGSEMEYSRQLFVVAMIASVAAFAGITAGERYTRALEAIWAGRTGPAGIVSGARSLTPCPARRRRAAV